MKIIRGSLAASLLVAAAASTVAAPPGTQDRAEHVSAARLRGYVATTKDGLAVHNVFADPAASALIVRRDGPAEVERHAAMSDIMIAREGSIEITLGGRIQGGRETAPGEWRGGAIVGGRRQMLRPGDMLWIPAGLPHQMVVKRGISFTYLAVKVKTR